MKTTQADVKLGDRVKLAGDHPWAGSSGEVVADAVPVGMSGTPMFRVRLERDDAMDGHECFAERRHMRKENSK